MLRFAILMLFPAVLVAQEAPRAQPVDPALQGNPAEDSFQHARNVYESAKRSNGAAQLDLYRISADRFSRYLNQFPDHPNAEAAWWYLGESFYGIGRVEDAKRCFHSLLNRFGKGRYAAAAAYKLGADHFNNRQYALAATLFEKLASIATNPTDRQRGLYYTGKSFELQGRDRQAGTYYKAVIGDGDPNNPYLDKARIDYGKLLSKEGKLDEALQLLDKVAVSRASLELRGEAALQAGAVAAKLGDAKRSDLYFEMVLTTSGMEEFRPDAQIAMMAARFDQKRYDDVISIFRRSVDRSEGEREAQRLMLAARAFMMLDRNADALPLFREVERLQPKESDLAFEATYFRLLCFFRIEGRHVLDQVEAFLQLYQKTHPRDPKIHTALLMKAETLYSDKKLAEAADAYRDIDPATLSEKNRRGMLYKRGRCLSEAGDPEGAAKSLDAFIEKYPEDERIPLAYAARGRASMDLGRTASALADFQKLIETTKDEKLLSLAYLESAEIHKQQNELDAMVKCYRDFLGNVKEAAPSATAKASYWAGWGLVKLGRGAEALTYLENARELAPDLYTKHAGLLLCLVHLAEKNPEPLITEVGKAIEMSYAGDLPEPLVRWAADQAFNAKDFINAARFYDLIADDENPELVVKEVWRFLGKARIESGDPGGALTAIEHALAAEQDPAWRADGLTDKGRALVNLKRLDEATKAVEAGLELRPEGRVGANLHLLRGDILMAQGKPDEAVRSYILPVQLMDDNDELVKPRALYKLIDALEKSGKGADAEKYRQELKQKYPKWKP
ncbi:tetratricopeptide repeat-containing protein [Haloferula helveola]|uniref:Tetratricopeptide repeat-containing protein n=1 Tax=Haloferula helveola TaxID=490095 RepID=A0ABN6H823_9BACT|nr:tetratricopeptide repeat-containing protein [Haloferula helveola]